MKERFRFNDLLTPDEMKVITHPEKWRWVSTLTTPDLRPISFPEYLEWGRDHGHSPSHRELFLALSGTCYFLLGDKVYRVRPGTVLMFNHYERHDYALSPWNKSFRHLWLHSSTPHAITSNLNAVDADKQRTDNVLKVISGHNPELMTELWNRCSDPAISTPALWAFLKSLITTSFYESLSDWRNTPATHPHETVVASVRDYILTHLHLELTLDSLSRIAGYSPYFFHRIFLRHGGKPLHRFIIEARLERAKQLLEEGHTVTSVSEQVGMTSPSYFSRFFKKNTRITPARWREIHQLQK